MSVLDRLTALFTSPVQVEAKPLPATDVPMRLARFWSALPCQTSNMRCKKLVKLIACLPSFKILAQLTQPNCALNVNASKLLRPTRLILLFYCAEVSTKLIACP